MDFEAFRNQYAPKLSSQQMEAVRSTDGYVMLLAVPGSGKTTVLVTRLAYLIKVCGIAPENILTVTYTVAATKDMRSRFADLFGAETAERIQFRTINGVSAMILRYYERSKGTRAFELAGEGELDQLIGEIYLEQKKEYLTDSEIKSFRTAIAYAKNQMLTEEEIEELGERIAGFPSLFRTYQERMQDRKLMDYDDQMVYALRILNRYPDILAAYQERYRYICVDEAQDTSKIQHTIIALLAQKSGNLFMVGDEDQSIYGFRAAYPEALLRFESRHPGAKVLLMEKNYRSTPEIIEKADAFIQKNRSRHPKHMSADRSHGVPVKEIKLTGRSQQYAYLMKIAESCRMQTAILYRDNDCALPLIDLLERRGIPYSVRRAEGGFFSHRVVRDICEIIMMAMEPTNTELFLRNYYKLNAPIPKKAAKRAAARAKESSPFYLLSLDEELPSYTRAQCKALKTHFENLLRQPADQAVYRIVHYMGYGDYLESHGMDSAKAEILELMGRQEDSPQGLLRRLSELEEILQNRENNPSELILSTIHSSKGLEYDRVYLMDVTDGILPKTGDDTDTDEERRIFYVAMTRAKNELNIFHITDENTESSFCKELFARPDSENRSGAAGRQRLFRKAKAPISPTGKKSAVKALRYASKDYIRGRRVRHSLFGSGVISSVKGDEITIRLDRGDEKVFHLPTLLEKDLIELEK